MQCLPIEELDLQQQLKMLCYMILVKAHVRTELKSCECHTHKKYIVPREL